MSAEREYIVTIVDYDPNFDEAPIITTYRFVDVLLAKAFLHWSWEDWRNSNDSDDIDKENSFHEETYGVLKYFDGWKVEWFCTGTSGVPKKFFNEATRYLP